MTRENASLHIAKKGLRVPATRPYASLFSGRALRPLTRTFTRARPTASQPRPLSASPRPSLYREGRTQGGARTEHQIGAEMPSRILDRLLPSQALRWGRLTRETDQWLADAVRWQIANIPATLTRPCPAFSRLDSLMGNGGKVEADAWVPGQLDGWWRA